MSTAPRDLKGVPLTEMERRCVWMKSRGRPTQEIGSRLAISHRSVNQYLHRAGLKLGTGTVEETVSVFTRAQVLRDIARELDRLKDLYDVSVLRQGLRRHAEELERRSQPDCVHGRQLLEEYCQKCLDTKPGSHHFQSMELINPDTSRAMYRCFLCGRKAKVHGRDHRLKDTP